jgi:hypothetical protein
LRKKSFHNCYTITFAELLATVIASQDNLQHFSLFHSCESKSKAGTKIPQTMASPSDLRKPHVGLSLALFWTEWHLISYPQNDLSVLLGATELWVQSELRSSGLRVSLYIIQIFIF